MIYKLNKKDLILFIFSIFLAFLGFSRINKIVYRILPKEEVVISSYDKSNKGSNNYITLLKPKENNEIYNLKTSFLNNKNKDGLSYNEVSENGYSLEAIHLNSPKTEFRIKLKKIPNVKIVFHKIGLSDKILIKSRNNSIILDISKYKVGDIIEFFPFRESKILILYNLSFYFLFGGIIFFSIKSICLVIRNIKRKKYKIPLFFYKYNPMKMTLLIYILIIMYVSIKFFTNTLPENYKEAAGDQGYYWMLGTILKNRDFITLYNATYVVRGYITYILVTFSQIIGDILNIPKFSLWIYYLINNIFISLLLGYILPELNNKLNKKKSKNYQIFLLFLIFTIFWKSVYYVILTDFLGVTFLLWSILNILSYFQSHKNKYAFFSGFFLAIASLYRVSYKLGVYFIIVAFILNLGYYFYKNKKVLKFKNSFLLYFILGITIVCLPQIKINYEKGHLGLFPFDRRGAWGYELAGDFTKSDDTLADQLMDLSLTSDFTMAWLYKRTDPTAIKIKENFVGSLDSKISLKQGISAFTTNPIDAILLFSKKLFFGLNIKTSELYPKFPYASNSSSYRFAFLNYFIISTFFYFVSNKNIRKRFFSKKEIILGSILILLYILPQFLFHVEWRFYIILYLMSYYVFSFKMEEYLKNSKKYIHSYFKFLTMSIFILFLLNSFYY